MTKPNSRSIRTSLAINTAKPAIAVTPEASTAAPVGSRRLMQRRPQLTPGPTLLAEASSKNHAELGSDSDRQRPQRSRHRVERDALSQSTSADQPVAITIGTSGTSARGSER